MIYAEGRGTASPITTTLGRYLHIGKHTDFEHHFSETPYAYVLILVVAFLLAAASACNRGPSPMLTPTPLPSVISPADARSVIQLERWGQGTLNAESWSPDGKTLAVASSLGIYLHDAETLQESRFFETGVWITSVAWDPDGRTLASAGADGMVELWDARTGRLLRTLEGHTGWVYHVAFPQGGGTPTGDGGHILA